MASVPSVSDPQTFTRASERGWHFAAFEVPETFVGEVATCVRPVRETLPMRPERTIDAR